MTRATSAEQIASRAYRLKNAIQEKPLAAWCEAREIDHALMPEGRRFADLKLLALDMDATLITIECIDEIADATGKKAEVSAITEATMRGEITDFKDSLRQRVGKLVGVTEADMARVLAERLKLSPGAETLVRAAQAAGGWRR